jgi:hypothetical protein
MKDMMSNPLTLRNTIIESTRFNIQGTFELEGKDIEILDLVKARDSFNICNSKLSSNEEIFYQKLHNSLSQGLDINIKNKENSA